VVRLLIWLKNFILDTLNVAVFKFLLVLAVLSVMAEKSVEPEFWETVFVERSEMWGLQPTPSTVLTKQLFLENGIRNVLIPGIGYGRNAQAFKESGMAVTGIEISKTAIEMARKHYGHDMIIHHGSVTHMPFDTLMYDGIYCFGLIHLLDANERAKLVRDCFNQLAPGGQMVFVAISKEARTYGTGTYIEKDRYEIHKGVKMFFYDRDSIQAEFGEAGLYEIAEITENFPFFIIKCKK